MGKTFSTGLLTNAISTNGSNNVGIGGAADATAKLKVTGAATFSRNDVANISVTIANAYINQGNLINFQQNKSGSTINAYIGHGGDSTGNFIINNGTQAVAITQAGNVGIGTSSPTGLSVATNLIVKGATDKNGYIQALSGDGASSVALYSGSYSGDNPSLIFQNSLRFGTATDSGTNAYTERMRITSGGDVAINSTSASAQLYVKTPSGQYTKLIARFDNGDGTPCFTVDGQGNVRTIYIGSNTGTSVVLDSNGYLRQNSSSIRYKKDVEPIDIGLEFVNSLNPVKYNLKSNGEAQIGFIAEDFPDERLVSFSRIDMENENSILQRESVNYSNLTAALVKAIQEQNEIITNQGQAIDELKALIAAK